MEIGWFAMNFDSLVFLLLRRIYSPLFPIQLNYDTNALEKGV